MIYLSSSACACVCAFLAPLWVCMYVRVRQRSGRFQLEWAMRERVWGWHFARLAVGVAKSPGAYDCPRYKWKADDRVGGGEFSPPCRGGRGGEREIAPVMFRDGTEPPLSWDTVSSCFVAPPPIVLTKFTFGCVQNTVVRQWSSAFRKELVDIRHRGGGFLTCSWCPSSKCVPPAVTGRKMRIKSVARRLSFTGKKQQRHYQLGLVRECQGVQKSSFAGKKLSRRWWVRLIDERVWLMVASNLFLMNLTGVWNP